MMEELPKWLLCCCLGLKSLYLCSVGSPVCQNRQRCPDTWGYQRACPVPSHRWWPPGGGAWSETSTNRPSSGIHHDCRQEDEETRGNLPQLLFQSDFCAAQTVRESLCGASSSALLHDKTISIWVKWKRGLEEGWNDTTYKISWPILTVAQNWSWKWPEFMVNILETEISSKTWSLMRICLLKLSGQGPLVTCPAWYLVTWPPAPGRSHTVTFDLKAP